MDSSFPRALSWTSQDVVAWATQAKLSPQTIATLAENQVDGTTLVTLSKEELRSELGIVSLPSRRYLWDMIKNLKEEEETNDYSAAVIAHEEEIKAFSLSYEALTGEAVALGGGAASFKTVLNELITDAQRQKQVIEDHLMAHRMQRTIRCGQEVYEDAELAREEQERLNQLFAQAESDLQYAETLASSRERAAVRAHREQETCRAVTLIETSNDHDIQTVNRISSLFGLSIQACAANKINVAEAFKTGKIKPIPHPALASDDESDDEGDRKPAALGSSLRLLPYVDQCNVCYEDGVKGYTLACGHRQCIRCTRKLFKAALKDSSLLPLRCCEIPIDMNISSQLLKPDAAAMILKRTEEIEATNKMYCPTCSGFLNLDLIDTTFTSDLICGCGALLCTTCKSDGHPGVTCRENKAMKTGSDDLVLEISRDKGWKQCPGCSMIIELRSGCNHMTCVNCRHEFCYNCLRPWNSRNAQCSSGQCDLWDEDRLIEAGEARVQQEEAALGAALPREVRQERLRHAVAGLRANEVCIHDWRRTNGYQGECPNCSFEMWAYGMRCRSDCGSTVCYTCAHYRIPQRGWR